MLQRFYSRKGQGISAEYVLLISLVALGIMAMTVYVRRTLQGRMRDANNEAIKRSSAVLGKPVQFDYEPYYVESTTNTDASSVYEETNEEAGGFGFTRKTFRRANGVSAQLPVKDAK